MTPYDQVLEIDHNMALDRPGRLTALAIFVNHLRKRTATTTEQAGADGEGEGPAVRILSAEILVLHLMPAEAMTPCVTRF